MEHEFSGSQRWLVSYADFITLLFAFFVVMYSISQVNEGKYRILSDALINVFRENPVSTVTPGENDSTGGSPVDPGLVSGPAVHNENVIEAQASASQEELSLPKNQPATEDEKREFSELYQNLNESLKSLIDAGVVDVRGNEDWIEVEMRSALLFESGSDQLGTSAEPLLQEIASRLTGNNNLLRIRGYTDDQPIETDRFPSNWELASSRSVAVVRSMQRFGVTPQRMAVEGYGEYNPVTSNATEEGRARNRRVVLAISRFQMQQSVDGIPANTPSVETTVAPNNAPIVENNATNNLNVPESTKSNVEPQTPFEVVRLPSGGLLIRGKETDPNQKVEKTPEPIDPERR